MCTKYKIRNQEALHFISFATVELIDVWLLVVRDFAIHLWAKVADTPVGVDLLTLGITGKDIRGHNNSYIWMPNPGGIGLIPVVKMPYKC